MSDERPAKIGAPLNGLSTPPPYNEYDSTATSSSQPAPLGPAHNDFGPTPITAQTLTSYAYYDAHSPYSLAQANVRARWRFIVALLWAFGLWLAVACLVSIELTAHRHGWRSLGYHTR